MMAVNEKIHLVNQCFLRKQIKVDAEWLNGYEKCTSVNKQFVNMVF